MRQHEIEPFCVEDFLSKLYFGNFWPTQSISILSFKTLSFPSTPIEKIMFVWVKYSRILFNDFLA